MAEAGESSRPQDSNFYQQRLKAWQPILTPKWVIISFLVVGIVFLPLGLILKAASDGVVEVSVQYDGDGADQTRAPGCSIGKLEAPGGTCTITLRAPEDMDAPVYVYYELDNFYQNHRRYVKSLDNAQLKDGKIVNPSSDCDPLKSIGNGADAKLLQPCGLIANSMFNDTIAITTAGFAMSETGIAWESDKDSKFKRIPVALKDANKDRYRFIEDIYPGVVPADEGMENEHFIVWMRTAALPKFRKLYGKIHKDIKKGTVLTFDIDKNFKVTSFDGKKSLVISTTSWLGGKNPFLGIAYLVVGSLCIALAGFFAVKQRFGGRNLGDTNLLVWNAARR